MKILWLDPVGGIAGDMCLGALCELGVPLADIETALAGLALPGWRLASRAVEVNGIGATKVDVVLDTGPDAHRGWTEIRRRIENAGLPDRAQQWALDAFSRLAHAEAAVHRVDVEAVHFHEVGAVDALVDICGTAVAVARLGPDAVFAGPPPLGRGTVRAAHGALPVPAPATLEVLRGVPVASCETVGELTTPTGAALLATLAAGRVGPMPALVPERIGYGAGDARWPDRPNLLRAVLGRASDEAAEVNVVETEVDDLSPELLSGAVDAVFAAGALDVYTTPVVMKKGRAGHLVTALCREGEREAVIEALLAETGTFGVRWSRASRVELARGHETVETPYGPVRVKVARRAGGAVLTAAPEWEDCRARAHEKGAPVREVYAAAQAAWRSGAPPPKVE